MESGFELHGTEDDEARSVVHRATGFSVVIPGHPAARASEARACELLLTDAAIEVMLRMDSIPGTLEAKPLAAALALAYMKSASDAPGELEMVPLPLGADAAFSGTYTRRGGDDRAMEHATVIVRRGATAVDALYQVTRFRRGELSPLEWANVRTAIAGSQDWTAHPHATSVWPASEFADPGVVIKLRPWAWTEAQAKAPLLANVSDEDISSLMDILLTFGVSDDPPTHVLQRPVLDLGARQIAMRCTSATAEVLLRNFYEIKQTHDLRAWCAQCLWALGNRPR